MANLHSNKPILIARGGKLLPIYMEPPPFQDQGDIRVGGCAPVIFADAGTGATCFTYFPSSIGTVNVLGDAVAIFTSGVKERGGKGVPRRRKVADQRTIHFYDAHAYFENTLQLGGEAYATFRPAPYQFIKSLPKVSKPDPKRDSEFVDLFKRELAKPQTTTFRHVAQGGITAQGTADDEYFDFMDFIIANDEDLIISDVLSADGFPIITTVFDYTLEKQKREEEELFTILELL